MMSCIKGKEYSFRFIFLFNPQKSIMNRIVLFFLGIAKEGHTYSENFIGDNNPSSTNLTTSYFIVAFSECRIRKDLAQNGFSPSFSSRETGEPGLRILFVVSPFSVIWSLSIWCTGGGSDDSLVSSAVILRALLFVTI